MAMIRDKWWRLPRVKEGGILPKRYGFVRWDYVMNEMAVALVPFNLLFRDLDWVVFYYGRYIQRTDWLDSPYAYAYRDGRIAGYREKQIYPPKDYEV